VNFACSETRKKIWLKNFFCLFELLSFFRGSFKLFSRSFAYLLCPWNFLCVSLGVSGLCVGVLDWILFLGNNIGF
jgi:hypothetical protein